ncbi:MAG TPA: tetratricopeptide repeat protein [Rhodopirellula baltica]|uniref:O-GlcNAc transferase n=1 Tax=Rhodopirellula baltica (strain DSM 10527 / NCIMB 13988 / SH1) TaxID=243090 RepID=Q7UIN0_RHOBA|nr:tetratricopeptide repeat protein [Rhodopirellula baltica]CAD77584.1 O-GlcNAc transferase [Rhodopirellula baltica SH 1]HBE61560.1 tetratricopeptide repeat protein [Rhodopirellula baltica]
MSASLESNLAAADEPSRSTNSLVTAMLAAALFALTMIAYLPAIQGGFIWDDDDYVTENPTLHTINGLIAIWTDPSATPQYYPIVHSSFWIENHLWGLNPMGYHLVNVIVHCISALLLWRVLSRFSVPGAYVAALLFAVHPMHVESVAWITERKNVLSGLFTLLTILCWLRYWDFTQPEIADESAPRNRRWYALALLCFIAALLSKTVASTLPAALIVMIWWKRGTVRLRDVAVLAPFFVIGIGMGLLTVWLEKFQVGASGIDWELSPWQRVLIAGRALWFYAGKLVWPTELIFTYPRWEIDVTSWSQNAFPIAAVAVMVTLFLMRHRLGRGPIAAVCLYAGTLFPALGFFDVYPMRFSFVADHFAYMASVPLIALIVGVVATWLQSKEQDDEEEYGLGRHLPKLMAGGAALLLATVAFSQATIYSGLEVLWRDTLEKNPNSFMAHNNLGALLNRRGDYLEAETHLRRSLEIKPNFADSVINLAQARQNLGDLEEALSLYTRATELNPGLAEAYNGLGATQGMMGDFEASEATLKQAIEIDPNYANSYGNLATLRSAQGRNEEAIELFQKAVQLAPERMDHRTNLGRVLMSAQRWEDASKVWQSVLDESPEDVSALLNLGVIAANQQRTEDAIGYFERVLEIVPNHLSATYNLGAMHDALGNTSEAEQYFRRAERLQPQQQ